MRRFTPEPQRGNNGEITVIRSLTSQEQEMVDKAYFDDLNSDPQYHLPASFSAADIGEPFTGDEEWEDRKLEEMTLAAERLNLQTVDQNGVQLVEDKDEEERKRAQMAVTRSRLAKTLINLVGEENLPPELQGLKQTPPPQTIRRKD